MAFVEWNDYFVLGLQQFDEHHQHLFGIINRLYDEIGLGTAKDNIENVLDELIDYATYHFAAEENWMRRCQYPNIDKHADEHNSFCKRIAELEKDFYSRNKYSSFEVLTFLKEWLSNHILTMDFDYRRFIADKAIPDRVGRCDG